MFDGLKSFFNFDGLKSFFNLSGTVISIDKAANKYGGVLKKIRDIRNTFSQLSDNELRQQTDIVRQSLADNLTGLREQIDSLKQNIDSVGEDLIEKKKKIETLAKLEIEQSRRLKENLTALMPFVYAILCETAYRWSKGNTLMVSANYVQEDWYDDLPNLSIADGIASWTNTWNINNTPSVWNMSFHENQILAAVALHDEHIIEMDNGEGKTLVGTLPIFLNALLGKGVHVMTANEYLAQRDAAWMRPLFGFHGLSVACIDTAYPNTQKRRNAYQMDITYGSTNEFGFDYLRENILTSEEAFFIREPFFALIDEIDFVLIDEARTPFILSGPAEYSLEAQMNQYAPAVKQFVEEQLEVIEKTLSTLKEMVAQSQKNETDFATSIIYINDVASNLPDVSEFIIENDAAFLIQKTKRLRYSFESVKYKEEIKDRAYFLYGNSGIQLTDTGKERLAVLTNEPHLYDFEDLHTELETLRVNTDTQSFKTAEDYEHEKRLVTEFKKRETSQLRIMQLIKAFFVFREGIDYVVDAEEVQIIDENTGRISVGRTYSGGLHQALEAKESLKIQDATRQLAAITLQNFIKLYPRFSGMTGTAATDADEFWQIYDKKVVQIPPFKASHRKINEDLVYKTKREKWNAVATDIQEVNAQTGQPILIGTTTDFDSEHLSQILFRMGIPHKVLNSKYHREEAEIIAQAGELKAVTISTKMAGRGTDIRLTEDALRAGGLYVIGTERHDSQRRDQQLSGRAGRHGNPGKVQYYISLEDNLMTLFQSERIAGLMDKMGHKEGESIQHSMVTKSIRRAQKKVEDNNFNSRQSLYHYDWVMDLQRHDIYSRRKKILKGTGLRYTIINLFYDVCETIITKSKKNHDYDTYFMPYCGDVFGESFKITKEEYEQLKEKDLADKLFLDSYNHYQSKVKSMAQTLLPIVKQVYFNEGHRYKNIAVPISDGKRAISITANLEDALKPKEGESIITDIEKAVCIAYIDESWVKHIQKIDDTKSDVDSRGDSPKSIKIDPRFLFSKEVSQLYENLVSEYSLNIVRYLSNTVLVIQQDDEQSATVKNTEGRYRSIFKACYVLVQGCQEDLPLRLRMVYTLQMLLLYGYAKIQADYNTWTEEDKINNQDIMMEFAELLDKYLLPLIQDEDFPQENPYAEFDFWGMSEHAVASATLEYLDFAKEAGLNNFNFHGLSQILQNLKADFEEKAREDKNYFTFESYNDHLQNIVNQLFTSWQVSVLSNWKTEDYEAFLEYAHEHFVPYCRFKESAENDTLGLDEQGYEDLETSFFKRLKET